jgi:hypothetical protein
MEQEWDVLVRENKSLRRTLAATRSDLANIPAPEMGCGSCGYRNWDPDIGAIMALLAETLTKTNHPTPTSFDPQFLPPEMGMVVSEQWIVWAHDQIRGGTHMTPMTDKLPWELEDTEQERDRLTGENGSLRKRLTQALSDLEAAPPLSDNCKSCSHRRNHKETDEMARLLGEMLTRTNYPNPSAYDSGYKPSHRSMPDRTQWLNWAHNAVQSGKATI